MGAAAAAAARVKGLERDAGHVVDGEELDAVAGALDFGFGLDEDVAAGAAAFAAFGAEEGGDGEEVAGEAGWGEGGVRLFGLLGGAGGAGPAFCAEAVDDCGVVGGVVGEEALGWREGFAHGGWFGGFLAVGAQPGVEGHDAGEGAGGGVVEVA